MTPPSICASRAIRQSYVTALTKVCRELDPGLPLFGSRP